MLHATLRNSVISYFGDELELIKNDIFKTWKVLKHIIGLDGNKTKQKFNILIDDKLVIDSLDIANGFNNCFVSVGPKLANNLKSGIDPSGAYAGFLKGGGGPNFKISGILDIHAAKRHIASSEAASLC